MPRTKLFVAGKLLLLVIIGVGITLATGLVYGHLMQRWGPKPDLLEVGRQLETFPAQIGDWQLVSDEPMSDRVVQMLSCTGHVNRQYLNERTGQTVFFALIVGPSGPTAVHTPEICYSSRDYSVQDERKVITLLDHDGQAHTFWYVVFRSHEATADELCVYYAWAPEGTWNASRFPRFEFAGRPLLYKLQLAGLVAPGEAGGEADPGRVFLTDWLRSGWSFRSEPVEFGPSGSKRQPVNTQQ